MEKFFTNNQIWKKREKLNETNHKINMSFEDFTED